MSRANRKRAGRKRVQGVEREPNGRAKRNPTEVQEAARETVTMDRMKRYGLTRPEAQTSLAGYAIGRMALKGELGDDWKERLDAIESYVEATADFLRIKYPMHPMPKAMDYIVGKGQSLKPEPSLKLVNKIVGRYERLYAILCQANGIERMHFHNAAFDDRLNSEEAKKAVRYCAELLMAG